MKKRGAIFIGLAGILVMLTLASVVPALKRRALASSCGNRMIAIAYVTFAWSNDHDNRLPHDFRSMSNELSATQILICPADPSRQPGQWSSLSAADCTYEILTPGISFSDTNGPFFRCPIHGYLGYPNGAVFDGTRRLQKGVL